MQDIVKLDLKDKKLLFELDFNARSTFSELGKKIRLSAQGVEYKLNVLVKKGVIKGFYPVIDGGKLGYTYCRLTITLQNLTRHKFKEITTYLVHHKKPFWVLKVQGMYDIFIATWSESLTDFRNFTDEFQGEYGKYIKRKSESVATDVIHLQHRYLLNIEKTDEIHLKETSQRTDIDVLDRKILESLCENARISLVEISKKVRESAKVVAYRIKRMEKEKLILGYRPMIDHNKIGYTYYKLFISLNNINKEELNRLKEHIKNNSLVIYLIEGISLDGDLDIELMVKDNKELFDFVEDLKFKFPNLIGEYISVIFMDTLKVKYLPF